MSQGLTKEDKKVKSKETAKTFEKNHVKCGRRTYKNGTCFYTEYYDSKPEMLVQSIKEYRHIKGSPGKDEHYLEELLIKQSKTLAAAKGAGVYLVWTWEY